jgi:hypothetical protein
MSSYRIGMRVRTTQHVYGDHSHPPVPIGTEATVIAYGSFRVHPMVEVRTDPPLPTRVWVMTAGIEPVDE